MFVEGKRPICACEVACDQGINRRIKARWIIYRHFPVIYVHVENAKIDKLHRVRDVADVSSITGCSFNTSGMILIKTV